MTSPAYYGIGLYGDALYSITDVMNSPYTGPLVVMLSVDSPEIPLVRKSSELEVPIIRNSSIITVPVTRNSSNNVPILKKPSNDVEIPIIMLRLKNQKI